MARRLGHDQEAVRLLEQVLREAPLDAEQRATVAVKLGRASVHVRPTPQVAELLADVLATDPPGPVRGQLRFLLAGLLNFLGGDPARQYALYRGAVDDLAGRPDLQAWAMAGLGVPMVPGIPLAEHLEWLRRILALLPEISDPAFRVWLLGKVAMVRIPIGDPQWRPIVDQLRAATGDAPRQSREVNAYYSVGAAACYAGRHELADQLVQAGLAGVATAESEPLAQALRSVAALLDYCRGRGDGLAGRVQALLAELAPGTRTRLDVEVAAAGVALAGGDLDAAEHRLAEVTARAEQLGCFDLLPLPVAMQIRLALIRGRPEQAVAAAERAEAVLEPTAVWASLARLLPWLVQARTEAGQPRAAGELLDRWGAELYQRDAPLAAATVPHARGVLAATGVAVGAATGATAGVAVGAAAGAAAGATVGAAAERPDRAAAELLLTAAAGYDRLGCPYEAAQAREQAARVLLAPAGRAAGSRSAAVAPLRAALVGYRRSGAGWDLARAAELARRHGLPVPSPHRLGRRGYGSRLSPRESGVAELAATGLTNKEIAERLFLSPSTVNKHVRAAMRKLGVRSRTELAYRHGAGNGGGNGDRGNNGSD